MTLPYTVERVGDHALAHGDCLDVMQDIDDASIDLILADLPYGTTYAQWDDVIPADQLWSAYRRISKPRCAIVLTASQPFTSMLVASNPAMFSHEWIWDKENAANFANANRQPLKQHENILVFAKQQPTYNPQKTPGKKNHVQGKNAKANVSETRLIKDRVADDTSGLKYPKTILHFPKHSSQVGLHPTQKPVDLMRYLIRTYTNPGEVVLDNAMGSGTTGVAAIIEGRIFKGIEKDAAYFQVALDRIRQQLMVMHEAA